MDKAEETAFPALDELDDLPKLNQELVAWANKEAAAIAEFAMAARLETMHRACSCCCW
jgi:hypothetical protein